jgi:hypothetical protein
LLLGELNVIWKARRNGPGIRPPRCPWDSGATASITTASAAAVNAAVSVQLDIGWYWWAINVDNSVVCVSSVTANNQALSAYAGTATQGNALTSSATLCSLNFSQTYGTWPDLTGQTFTESTGSNLAPIMQFKVASIP